MLTEQVYLFEVYMLFGASYVHDHNSNFHNLESKNGNSKHKALQNVLAFLSSRFSHTKQVLTTGG